MSIENSKNCFENLLAIPLFLTDQKGNLKFCNKEFEQFFKVDCRKFIHKNIKNLSLKVFKKEEGFILSSVKNGRIIKTVNIIKKGNFYYKESLLRKGNKEHHLSHFAQKLGKEGNFLELIFEIGQRAFDSKSREEKSLLLETTSRNFLIRKALYSLSKKYEIFFDSILYNSQTLLGYNLEFFKKNERHLLNNILIESERAKRLSKTISYLGAPLGEQKIQNLNDRISETEEFSKLLLGNETEITYALSDGIPYVNVREGIIEDFILQVIIFVSSIATKNTRVLIESGRKKENGFFRSFVQIRASRTKPEAPDILELVKTNKLDRFFDFNLDIFKDDGVIDIFAEKSSIVFNYTLNSIEKFVSLSEWRGSVLPKGQGTILILEDENALRDAIRMTLEKNGYNVHQAKTINEAELILSKLKKRIDLFISDIILPDGSGFDFATRFFSNTSVPVLFMSTLSQDELPHFKEAANLNYDFLQKPFERFILITKIKKLMGERN